MNWLTIQYEVVYTLDCVYSLLQRSLLFCVGAFSTFFRPPTAPWIRQGAAMAFSIDGQGEWCNGQRQEANSWSNRYPQSTWHQMTLKAIQWLWHIEVVFFLGNFRFSIYIYVHHVHIFVNNSPYDFLLKKPSCFFSMGQFRIWVPSFGNWQQMRVPKRRHRRRNVGWLVWGVGVGKWDLKILKKCLQRNGGLKFRYCKSIVIICNRFFFGVLSIILWSSLFGQNIFP